MNFLDMFDENIHHGALREINFNGHEAKEIKDVTDPLLPEKLPGVTTDVSSSANRKMRMQKCSAEGCKEVSYKARTSRSWVCKMHQTKMNKEMLKRRLEERCRTPVAEVRFSIIWKGFKVLTCTVLSFQSSF